MNIMSRRTDLERLIKLKREAVMCHQGAIHRLTEEIGGLRYELSVSDDADDAGDADDTEDKAMLFDEIVAITKRL